MTLLVDVESMTGYGFQEEYYKMASYAWRVAADHGFHKNRVPVSESIALMHSELSECLEAFRNEKFPMSTKIPAFSLAEEEMADLVIRAMDFGVIQRLRIAQAVIAKMKYNNKRPHQWRKF